MVVFRHAGQSNHARSLAFLGEVTCWRSDSAEFRFRISELAYSLLPLFLAGAIHNIAPVHCSSEGAKNCRVLGEDVSRVRAKMCHV